METTPLMSKILIESCQVASATFNIGTDIPKLKYILNIVQMHLFNAK